MSFKINATMDDGDVVKATESIKRRATSIRKDVVATTVSIMRNWAKSGDVATAALRANTLMNSVDASHAQKIVNWFGKHAGFMLVDADGDKTLGYDADKTTLSTEEFQAVVADDDVYALTQDKAPEPYVLRSKLTALIEAAEKKRSKGLKEGDDVPSAMIEALRAIAA